MALPVALPPLVGVIAFLFLYGESGIVSRAVQAAAGPRPSRPGGSPAPGAILLVHAYSMYVYFYLFTRAALARLDGALLEAAASLGAGPAAHPLRVTLPLLRPALAGAALLDLHDRAGSFSAPYIFGGGFRVMTTQIVASKLNGDVAMAQVETVVLALVALAGLLAPCAGSTAADRAAGARCAASRRAGGACQRPGPRALAAARAGAWPLLLLLPHLTLVLISLRAARHLDDRALPPVLDARQLPRAAVAAGAAASGGQLAVDGGRGDRAARWRLGFAAARLVAARSAAGWAPRSRR